uniref:Uncharacterized protein n=1 Tax=Oryza brachyantha TaxID=4533 RepID=J3L136_ORYBR
MSDRLGALWRRGTGRRDVRRAQGRHGDPGHRDRPLLIDLIAFEQTQAGEEPRLLTGYVALMGQLVVTTRDVKLLRRRGVLESLLADDDEPARFFSRIGRGPRGVADDESSVRGCSPALRRDYIASPWSAISVVVAAVVVFLAATQTSPCFLRKIETPTFLIE